MIHESKSMAINENSAPIPHHKNGFQNYRAIMALSALTGNFDRKGGQLPGEHTFTHQIAGFTTLEDEFARRHRAKGCSPSSRSHQVSLWYHMERRCSVWMT